MMRHAEAHSLLSKGRDTVGSGSSLLSPAEEQLILFGQEYGIEKRN
jgi:hypothetical protein